jgi:hypothetical protein
MFIQEVIVNRNGTFLDLALLHTFRDELIPAVDLEDLLSRYRTLAATLDSLGITKSATLKLDKIDSGMQVTVNLVPASRIKAKAGTMVNQTGADLYFEVNILRDNNKQGSLNNLHGHGQSIDSRITYKLDPQLAHENQAHIGYTVPISLISRYGIKARLENKTLGHDKIVHETLKGFSAWAEHWHQGVAHSLTVNWDWRENVPSRTTRRIYDSLFDRLAVEQSGHSLKTSIVHSAVFDAGGSGCRQFDPGMRGKLIEKDHRLGFKLTSRTELAGVLGSVMFGKWEGIASMVTSIWPSQGLVSFARLLTLDARYQLTRWSHITFIKVYE